jgi:hypothetical protein
MTSYAYVSMSLSPALQAAWLRDGMIFHVCTVSTATHLSNACVPSFAVCQYWNGIVK